MLKSKIFKRTAIRLFGGSEAHLRHEGLACRSRVHLVCEGAQMPPWLLLVVFFFRRIKNKNDKLLLFIFIMAVLLPLALDAAEVLARPALAPKNEGALLQDIVKTFE